MCVCVDWKGVQTAFGRKLRTRPTNLKIQANLPRAQVEMAKALYTFPDTPGKPMISPVYAHLGTNVHGGYTEGGEASGQTFPHVLALTFE